MVSEENVETEDEEGEGKVASRELDMEADGKPADKLLEKPQARKAVPLYEQSAETVQDIPDNQYAKAAAFLRK